MRYRAYDPNKDTRLFRPPKYTGITLSLLSIFVLVSMLVVWEKMNPQTETSLCGLAWEKSQLPLESARAAFMRETGISVKIEYSKLPNLGIHQSLASNHLNHSYDFFVLPEAEANRGIMERNLFKEKIPLAYLPQAQETENNEDPLLVAALPRNSTNSTLSLLFSRYLAAPTRGQFDFASAGWIGVNGDQWKISPQLTLFVQSKYRRLFTEWILAFEKREGVSIHAEYLETEKMIKILSLTSKSRAKEYLPDLVWIDADSIEKDTSSLPFIQLGVSGNSTYPSALVGRWSKSQQTCRRFHSFVHELMQ